MLTDDLVIAQLADDLAQLEADVAMYREMLREALALLRQRDQQLAALHARYASVREEVRSS